jgi:hypothetical protein
MLQSVMHADWIIFILAASFLGLIKSNKGLMFQFYKLSLFLISKNPLWDEIFARAIVLCFMISSSFYPSNELSSKDPISFFIKSSLNSL